MLPHRRPEYTTILYCDKWRWKTRSSGIPPHLLRSTPDTCNNSRTLGKIFHLSYRPGNWDSSSVLQQQSPVPAPDNFLWPSLPLCFVLDEPSRRGIFLLTFPPYQNPNALDCVTFSSTLHRTSREIWSLLLKLSPIGLSADGPHFRSIFPRNH